MKHLLSTGLMAAVLALPLAGMAAPPTASAPKKTDKPADELPVGDGPVHPALGHALPQSKFVNDPAFGRDPFYPGSNRRAPRAMVKTDSKTVAPTVDRSSLLTLRGISGPNERRIALINNMTFIAGEEAAVRTTAGPMKIRVVEVLEKTARVVIEGELTPRELKLPEANSKAIQIQLPDAANKTAQTVPSKVELP